MRKKTVLKAAVFAAVGIGFMGALFAGLERMLSAEEATAQAAASCEWEYEETEDGIEITKYKGSDTEVAIPGEIGENPVVSIGDWAFEDCKGLTSITIPEGVKSIGDWAFGSCSGLMGITIPEGVKSIGEEAFFLCSGLTGISIPSSVTNIEKRAFLGCSGLESIEVEEENPVYDSRENSNAIIETESNRLILGCKNTVIPESVTSIGDFAFWSCRGLTDITIPEGVTSIGDSAFGSCSGLTGITIPESVTVIGDSAFYGCSGLTGITIPESVTVIGEEVFLDCWSLTDVYYSGTQEQWNEIERVANGDLSNAAIHYNSGNR